MTFLSGWRLVLLVAPAALLVAYVLVQRRRHSQVLRFTSVDLLDSVAPERSGWQRHVPAAALLVSLVVLTLAFAQPAMALRTAKDRATILLTLDTSASMSATDVAPSRLQAMEEQAKNFVKNLPKGIQIGLVTFSGSASLLVPPSTDTSPVLAALDSLTVGGGTATADGITTALAAIAGVTKGTPGKPTPAVIVLMSDGSPTVGTNSSDPLSAAADAAAQAKKPRSRSTRSRSAPPAASSRSGASRSPCPTTRRPWPRSRPRAAARRSRPRPAPSSDRSTTRSGGTSAS